MKSILPFHPAPSFFIWPDVAQYVRVLHVQENCASVTVNDYSLIKSSLSKSFTVEYVNGNNDGCSTIIVKESTR